MSPTRLDGLIEKLEKGHQKTRDFFIHLTPEQWHLPVYGGPDWNAANLLAHFTSAEQNLLELAKNVALNGSGAPEGFDIDRFNADEQYRLQSQSTQVLLAALEQSRRRTLDWVRTLTEEQLDKKGRHPALGVISIEEMIITICGHQILHVRDISRMLRSKATLLD